MNKKIFPYNSEIEEQIKKIKQALYLRMNGEVVEKMESKGLSYKFSYGTLLPEIKALSQKFTPNKLLAERLWHMEVRETMILATYLYPTELLTPAVAKEWAERVSTTEIAEILAMNLFSKIPQAEKLVKEWIVNSKQMTSFLAWAVLARITLHLSEDKLDFYLEHASQSIKKSNTALRTKIILVLKKMLTINSGKVMAYIDSWKNDSETVVFYNEIKEELDYLPN